MNTEYKFSLGQVVFSAQEQSVPYYSPCNLCDGEREVKIEKKDVTIKCPKCQGEGKVTNGGGIKCKVAEHIITQIIIKISQPYYKDDIETEIKYGLDGNSQLDEYQLFTTSEEAQTFADKQNKRCIGYTK